MGTGLECAIIVKQSRLRVDAGLQEDAMPRVFGGGQNELPGIKIAGIDVHSSSHVPRPA